MPKLGESVVEGQVARWLKAPGDRVEKLEPLLEISTDKIDTEVPAPAEGVLLQILVAEGETVDAGVTLAYIGQPDEKIEPPAATQSAAIHAPQPAAAASPMLPRSDSSIAERPTGRAFISPVVARMASAHSVNLEQVPGTGLNGRITKKDLLAFLDNDAPTAIPTPASAPIPAAAPALLTPNADEILHPLTTMRRAIAQHMVQSKVTSPHVTTLFEVDMTAVVRHREANKDAFAARGLHLTYTAYFVMATAAALAAHPRVNSRFSEAGIVQSRRVHIGIAVALDDGLIVPVLRDADEKNLQGVARGINDLTNQARSGKLMADATHGGTFTITNHGVSGSLLGTPIINQPQAGILGIGAIVKRPVVRSASTSLLPSADDAIVIRPMCYLSFSFDHRVLDGAEADRFVAQIKEQLESWT
ncbi:MAG: dihydrolipoamide acetyltransferase family protein [Caldilineaceae bacterium]